MMQQDGYIIYSLPENPRVTHIKEDCSIECNGSDLHIYVNDIEPFPRCFYYVIKTDKWYIPFKNTEGNYEWKEFEGTVLAFKFSIDLV